MKKIIEIYTVQLNRTYCRVNLHICIDCATSGVSTVIESIIGTSAKIWMRSGIHQIHVPHSYNVQQYIKVIVRKLPFLSHFFLRLTEHRLVPALV